MPPAVIPDIPQRAARLRICRLTISTLKSIHSDMFGPRVSFGAELDTILIACAVLCGHAEGRAMTANKLALYLGMRRTTVLRKLNRLKTMNVVFIADGKYYITVARLAGTRRLAERLNVMLGDSG